MRRVKLGLSDSEATLRPGKQDNRRARSGRHDAALIITLLDGSRSPTSMRKGATLAYDAGAFEDLPAGSSDAGWLGLPFTQVEDEEEWMARGG